MSVYLNAAGLQSLENTFWESWKSRRIFLSKSVIGPDSSKTLALYKSCTYLLSVGSLVMAVIHTFAFH